MIMNVTPALIILQDSKSYILAGTLIAVIIGWLVILYMQNPEKSLLGAFRKSRAKDFHNVKDGEYVRLHGTVETQESLLKAPLSDRPCVCYRAKIHEYDNKSDSKIVRDFNCIPFVIKAGKERAYIEPKSLGVVNAQLHIDFKDGTKSKVFPEANIKRLLHKHNVKISSYMMKSQHFFRYREAVITPGERVAVKGIAKWVKDPKTQKRRLEIHGTYDQPVLISDSTAVIRSLPKKL